MKSFITKVGRESSRTAAATTAAAATAGDDTTDDDCIAEKCSILNQKLDALLNTLDMEAQAAQSLTGARAAQSLTGAQTAQSLTGARAAQSLTGAHAEALSRRASPTSALHGHVMISTSATQQVRVRRRSGNWFRKSSGSLFRTLLYMVYVVYFIGSHLASH